MLGSVIRRRPTIRRLCACALVTALAACSATVAPESGAQAPSTGPLPQVNSATGSFLAGRFAQEQHDLPAAAAYLTRSLASDPENIELLQRALLALAADGRMGDAETLAKRLLAYDDEAAIASMLVAEQAAKAGDWAAVEAAMAGLPKRGLNSFMTPLMVAWARMGEGRVDAALDALAPLTQNGNYATLNAFHAALINDLADRRPAAEQNYRAVLSGTGGLTLRTVEAAAAFYQRQGEPDKANQVLARYGKEHPDSPALEHTASSLRPVDSAQAGMAEVMFGAAGSLRQGNAPDLALVFGRMALDLRPNFPLAQVMVADLLQSVGQVGPPTTCSSRSIRRPRSTGRRSCAWRPTSMTWARSTPR